MIKYFCDLCGREAASKSPGTSYEMKEKGRGVHVILSGVAWEDCVSQIIKNDLKLCSICWVKALGDICKETDARIQSDSDGS